MSKYCAFLLVLPLVLLAGEIEKEISFSISSLEFSTSQGYDVVRLEGCTPTTILGEPELAMKPVVVLVPPHALVTGVEAVSAEHVTVPGSYRILPVQHPEIYSVHEPFPFIEPKAEVYTSDAEYPGVIAELTHTGTKGGYQLATVTVYPLQYVPTEDWLILYTDIQVHVTYTEGQKIPQTVWKEEHEYHKTAVERMVVNPEHIALWSPPVHQCDRSIAPTSGSFDNPEYAIMVADGFESYFEPLKEWKTQKGVPTEIFSRDWILSNYSGADEPEQIRNFITDYHQNHGTFYFLCVGDFDIFPMKLVPTVSNPNNSPVPSDLYYQDYDEDLYSEVFVGRASIDDETQAQTFVNKVILYEKEPVDAGTGFYDKIFLPAYYVSGGAPLNDTVQAYDPDWWTDCPRYDFLDPLPKQEVSDSINAGVGYIDISSHGSYDGWGGANRDDADALVNTPPLTPIMMGNSCKIGELDRSGVDCYVEHMMNNPNGGTVAFRGNSRLGVGPISAKGRTPWLCIWFFELLANAPSDDVNNIGRICGGSLDMAVPFASDILVYHSMHELVLFGDPEMPQWTTTPDYLTVNHIDEVVVGNAIVDVEVTASGAPVENAKVCLMAVQDDVYEVGYTNAAGVASILIEPTIVADTILVTVTAANSIPYVGSIFIIPASGPYVIAKTLEIFDFTGNNNGRVNPGETIDLGVWAMNVGSDIAYKVKGLLSESDDYAAVTEERSEYGHITPGDSSLSDPYYQFTVTRDCPHNHAIQLVFEFTDRRHNTWISHRTVNVSAPLLTFQYVTVINDDNGNGALEPGESADLVVTLKNVGGETAEDVKSVLFSESPYITIEKVPSYYDDDIEPGAMGDNAGNPFHVTVSSEAPYLMETQFSQYVGAGIYVDMFEFTMNLGKYVPTDASELYYAYYSGGPHEHSPVFEWIAIDSTQTEYPGVSLNLSDENPVASLTLPFSIPFYSSTISYIGLAQHGYARIGGPQIVSFPDNSGIPSSAGCRGMVAGVWDHLDAGFPDSPSDIYYYYDEPNHRFIVEFFMVEHEEGGDYETFEIIIYDPAYCPTFDGRAEIVVQYLTAPQQEDITIGIESPDQSIGIQYYFNGLYHELAEVITDSFAIKYTTYPLVPAQAYCQNQHGSQSFDNPSTLPTRTLMNIPYPNPFSRNTTINYKVVRATNIAMQVYDATGRLVRTLAQRQCKPGYYSEAWNGCDDTGRKVSAGIYFVKFTTDDYSHVEKMIFLR